MAVRPNFTGVERIDGTLRVTGASGSDFQDIVDIRVVLAQGSRIAAMSVAMLGSTWDVQIPVGSFKPGPAVAFGVEMRRQHFTTISWADPLTIPKPPQN
jgi:hypothetical protein